MITFACSHCGQELAVQQTATGRSIACTRCSHAVLVPADPGNARANLSIPAGIAEAVTLPPQAPDTQATLPPPQDEPRSIEASETLPPGMVQGDPPATVDHAGAGSPGVSQQVSSLHGVADRREDALPAIPGFEVLGVLGRGGMGVVYKARQAGLKRIVALKMILSGTYADQAQRARFLREAEAVARLQHANIVQIYQIGEHDSNPYFSLEYCAAATWRNCSAALLCRLPTPPTWSDCWPQPCTPLTGRTSSIAT
jgi:DNA-directed RNA polymerase subunit RPC12/RpoP